MLLMSNIAAKRSNTYNIYVYKLCYASGGTREFPNSADVILLRAPTPHFTSARRTLQSPCAHARAHVTQPRRCCHRHTCTHTHTRPHPRAHPPTHSPHALTHPLPPPSHFPSPTTPIAHRLGYTRSAVSIPVLPVPRPAFLALGCNVAPPYKIYGAATLHSEGPGGKPDDLPVSSTTGTALGVGVSSCTQSQPSAS